MVAKMSISKIPTEVIDATRRPLTEALTMPGIVFHDLEIFSEELERIFLKMWLCVGRKEDLDKPGDFFTVNVGRESVIVATGRDGDVRAFQNVCRHRGTRILTEDSGCRQTIQCHTIRGRMNLTVPSSQPP